MAPAFAARWETARNQAQTDPDAWAAALEALTELYASQVMLLPAALEYETMLAHRLQVQGRAHGAIERTAGRAIELFQATDPAGVERIRAMLAQPPR